MHPDQANKLDARMASSIHTIYRPLARSRRQSITIPTLKPLRTTSPVTEEEPTSSDADDEDDLENEDFEEESTPRPPDAQFSMQKSIPIMAQQHHHLAKASTLPSGSSIGPHMLSSRSGSMATVRLQRRAQLAEKLKDVFELNAIDEVWAGMALFKYFLCDLHTDRSLEMPCWLLRSVCE